MSLSFIRLYCDKELDGIANKVLNDAQYGIWHKIKLLAARTVEREGYLEWATGEPLTSKEIAAKIRSTVSLTNHTIEKCLKHNLLENVNGVLHIVNWEADQLNKTQRAKIHLAAEKGKHLLDAMEGRPKNKE